MSHRRLIEVDDIRAVRPLAENIDEARVNVYIDEAERLDILPAIGGEIFKTLRNVGVIMVDEQGTELQDEAGNTIKTLDEGDLPADVQLLLNGGYWDTDKDGGCGCCKGGGVIRFEGIRAAECYFAYARLIRNNSVNVTRFGVVIKEADDSSPASGQQIAAISNDAYKIGAEYLRVTIEWWNATHPATADKMKEGKRRKFVAVGD